MGLEISWEVTISCVWDLMAQPRWWHPGLPERRGSWGNSMALLWVHYGTMGCCGTQFGNHWHRLYSVDFFYMDTAMTLPPSSPCMLIICKCFVANQWWEVNAGSGDTIPPPHHVQSVNILKVLRVSGAPYMPDSFFSVCLQSRLTEIS